MRRALATSLLLAVSTLAGVSAPSHAAGPHTRRHHSASAQLSVLPRPPIRHERLAIEGVFVGGARPFALEKRVHGHWRTVAHGRTSVHGYTPAVLSQHAGTKASTYRMVAPAAHGYRALHTHAKTVHPVAFHVSATAPATGTVGSPVTVTPALTPQRYGWPVVLQAKTGTSWTTVDTGRVPTPHGSFSVTPSAAGALQLRVEAVGTDGVRSATSPTMVVNVAPQTPEAVYQLTADPYRTGVTLAWWAMGPNYAGAVVRRAVGTVPPASPTDGDAVASSVGDNGGLQIHDGDLDLSPDTTYSYAVFPHNDADPIGYGPASTITVTTTAVPAWGAAVHVASAPDAPTGGPHAWVSVSCPSDRFCSAVNEDGSVSMFDGTDWSPATLIGLGIATSVSCPTSTFCAAVGNQGVATWNGTSWTTASLAGSLSWRSVSCVSASSCVLVDGSTHTWTWSGGTWTAAADFRPAGAIDDPSGDFNVISCATTTFCDVVGPGGVSYTFDGTTWSTGTTISGDDLDAISCASPSLCIAGETFDGQGIAWNGTDWSPTTLQDPKTPLNLDAASCKTADACVLANVWGDTWWYESGTWTPGAMVPISAASISCLDSAFCAAGGATDISVYR